MEHDCKVLSWSALHRLTNMVKTFQKSGKYMEQNVHYLNDPEKEPPQ